MYGRCTWCAVVQGPALQHISHVVSPLGACIGALMRAQDELEPVGLRKEAASLAQHRSGQEVRSGGQVRSGHLQELLCDIRPKDKPHATCVIWSQPWLCGQEAQLTLQWAQQGKGERFPLRAFHRV